MCENNDVKFGVDFSVITKMVYEENRLKSFTEKGQWPFSGDCNCTPEKMAEAGFYWCGTGNQPDLVRCFVCMQDFEDWEPADNPREEHKRLSPNCPFVKLGKSQKDCTVKEILEICQKGLLKLVDKAAASKVDEYNTQARKVREGLEQLGTQMNLNSH